MTPPASTQSGSGEPRSAAPAPARRLAVPQLVVEQTHWSWGLIGFYVTCAGTALGATIGAAGWWFFHSKTAVVFGGVLTAVSIVGCFYALAAARRRPGR